MRFRNMTLTVGQLRAFAAVVEFGTVTSAASGLSRTQPQVSRLVADLEAAVGFDLFSREGRKLVLTKRGARLFDEVKHALDSLDSVQRSAERIRDDSETGLRVLAPPYIAHTILPQALAKFRQSFPKRVYSVEIVARDAIGSWLPFRPFDIGIAALPFELSAAKTRRFAAFETVVVLPKNHPLRRKSVVTLADLVPYPFVAVQQAAAIRRRVDRIFEQATLKPMIVAETTNSVSVCEMVAQGAGVSIIDGFIPLVSCSKSIETRPWKPGSITELGFLYPAAGSISAIAEEFSAIVEQVVEEMHSKYCAAVDE